GSQYSIGRIYPAGAARIFGWSTPPWLKLLPRLPAGAESNSMAAIRRAASRDDPAASREFGRARTVDRRRLTRRSRSAWRPRPPPAPGVRGGERPTAPADDDATH